MKMSRTPFYFASHDETFRYFILKHEEWLEKKSDQVQLMDISIQIRDWLKTEHWKILVFKLPEHVGQFMLGRSMLNWNGAIERFN